MHHENLATLEGCLPYERHPEGAASAALLIHGYTGSPKDLRYLADRLADSGRAVSVPRLPGAGTDMSDLSVTRRRDWRRRVFDAWLDLKARYADISVVGYSMGAVLALDLAARVHSSKLALLAPAIRTTHDRTLALTVWAAPFARCLPTIHTGWKPQNTDDDENRELGRRYWSRRDLPSAAQFHRLKTAMRRRLGRVETPVLAVVSSEDPTVPPGVLKTLRKGLPGGVARSLVVTKCRHDVPQGADRRIVADAVIAWFDSDRS